MGENGCGTLVRNQDRNQNHQHTATRQASTPDMHRSQMTNYVIPVPGTSYTPSGTGSIASNMAMPGIWSDENGIETIPGIPDPGPVPPDPVLPENPQFQVPANPLLPPGYQEVLSYENLQYMNGFLRTQIGKYLRVEQLVTSSQIEDRFGYLVGVGLNYILLQQAGTGNISAIDYYSIKYVYVYYNQSEVPG
jgi:hypothetical protein